MPIFLVSAYFTANMSFHLHGQLRRVTTPVFLYGYGNGLAYSLVVYNCYCNVESTRLWKIISADYLKPKYRAMDPLDIYEEDLEKKDLQERHYKLLKELQVMCRELPPMFQQRLPNELLSNLANSLLDKTVFDIVKGLKDIQAMTENNLLDSRMKFINNQRARREHMLKKHKEDLAQEVLVNRRGVENLKIKQEKEFEEMKKCQEEELNRVDMKIILELDQVVSDQQNTLDRAGVPGFILSNKEVDIKLQMYLLGFISELSRREDMEA